MKALRWAALVTLAIPRVADGQIAERVTGTDDGTIRFTYETRDDVEICDQGIRWGEHQVLWHSRGWGDHPRNCRIGVAEVEVEVRNGRVRGVEVIRDRDDRSRRATDLGAIPAREAADFFLSLPFGGAVERGAKEAILPAMLADVEDLWRDLMEIAKDRDVVEEVRKSALFWLGQEAAGAATEGLADVAQDEDEGQEIRDAAIFALSQRPANEAVPVLMEIARSGEQAKTRRSAMFWLAQSNDERVAAFFEEILLRRVRE